MHFVLCQWSVVLSSGIVIITITYFGILCAGIVVIIVYIVLCWKIHKLKQKGKLMIRPLSLIIRLPSCNCMHPFNSSQHAISPLFLFQPPIRGAPPPPLLLPILGPLLPLTLTPSSFNPIPATVQWRWAIKNDAKYLALANKQLANLYRYLLTIDWIQHCIAFLKPFMYLVWCYLYVCTTGTVWNTTNASTLHINSPLQGQKLV